MSEKTMEIYVVLLEEGIDTIASRIAMWDTSDRFGGWNV